MSLVTAAAAGAPKKPGGAFAKVSGVALLKTEIAMVLSTPVMELGPGHVGDIGEFVRTNIPLERVSSDDVPSAAQHSSTYEWSQRWRSARE